MTKRILPRHRLKPSYTTCSKTAPSNIIETVRKLHVMCAWFYMVFKTVGTGTTL